MNSQESLILIAKITKQRLKILTLTLILSSTMITAACSLPDKKNNDVIIYTNGLTAGDALGMLLLGEEIKEEIPSDARYENKDPQDSNLEKMTSQERRRDMLFLLGISLILYFALDDKQDKEKK